MQLKHLFIFSVFRQIQFKHLFNFHFSTKFNSKVDSIFCFPKKFNSKLYSNCWNWLYSIQWNIHSIRKHWYRTGLPWTGIFTLQLSEIYLVDLTAAVVCNHTHHHRQRPPAHLHLCHLLQVSQIAHLPIQVLVHADNSGARSWLTPSQLLHLPSSPPLWTPPSHPLPLVPCEDDLLHMASQKTGQQWLNKTCKGRQHYNNHKFIIFFGKFWKMDEFSENFKRGVISNLKNFIAFLDAQASLAPTHVCLSVGR